MSELHPQAPAGAPGGTGGQWVIKDGKREKTGQVGESQLVRDVPMLFEGAMNDPDEMTFGPEFADELDGLVEDPVDGEQELYEKWQLATESERDGRVAEAARELCRSRGTDFDKLSVEEQIAVEQAFRDNDQRGAYYEKLACTKATVLSDIATVNSRDELESVLAANGASLSDHDTRDAVNRALASGQPVTVSSTWDASMSDIVNGVSSGLPSYATGGLRVGDHDVASSKRFPISEETTFRLDGDRADWRDGGPSSNSPLTDEHGFLVNRVSDVSKNGDGSTTTTYHDGRVVTSQRLPDDTRIALQVADGVTSTSTLRPDGSVSTTEVGAEFTRSYDRDPDGSVTKTSAHHNGTRVEQRTDAYGSDVIVTRADGQVFRATTTPHGEDKRWTGPETNGSMTKTRSTLGGRVTTASGEHSVGGTMINGKLKGQQESKLANGSTVLTEVVGSPSAGEGFTATIKTTTTTLDGTSSSEFTSRSWAGDDDHLTRLDELFEKTRTRL